ncbi:MAG: hypothetical protein ACE37B_01320 [Ilumatobacter sp.]|uniref:hypothetical protein n=1 Tax=Ilumatobacter sp. TaxID=1967498 RepID=UPI00391A7A91
MRGDDHLYLRTFVHHLSEVLHETVLQLSVQVRFGLLQDHECMELASEQRLVFEGASQFCILHLLAPLFVVNIVVEIRFVVGI